MQTGGNYFWLLTIKAAIHGVDLNRHYNIPVFKTGETAHSAHHDISAQVTARKSKESDAIKTAIAIGNFDISGLSRAMRLRSKGNKIHMAFPMFRNKILTILAAIFSGGFGFALIASIMTIYLPINLLRAPCTYPRGKTAGYYGAENRKRRATLTSKTQTIILPVARPRGIASSIIYVSTFALIRYPCYVVCCSFLFFTAH